MIPIVLSAFTDEKITNNIKHSVGSSTLALCLDDCCRDLGVFGCVACVGSSSNADLGVNKPCIDHFRTFQYHGLRVRQLLSDETTFRDGNHETTMKRQFKDIFKY